MKYKLISILAVMVSVAVLLTASPSFATGKATYGYDELDRLKWVQYEDGTVISYEYDKVGNRTAKSTYTGTLPTSYTVTATATGRGEVIPSGTLSVPSGGSQTFLLRPEPGTYAYVKIDGVSVNDYPYYNCAPGAPSRNLPCQAQGLSNWPDSQYTFQTVAANHTISVEFISPNGDLNGDGLVNASDTTIANSYIQYVYQPMGRSYYLYYPLPFNILAHADVYSTSGYLQPDARFDLSDAYTISQIAQGVIPPPVWPQACVNYPARIAKTAPESYLNKLSIQSAYNAAANSDTVQGNMYEHHESLLFDRDVSVTLDGGYLCDFTDNPNSAIIKGTVRISDGTVKLKNIRISQ